MGLALLPMPYGYYQVLRLVAFGCATFAAIQLWSRWQFLSVALALTALTFNPVFPVHLDRSVWSLLNIIAAAIFIIGWLRTAKAAPTAQGSKSALIENSFDHDA